MVIHFLTGNRHAAGFLVDIHHHFGSKTIKVCQRDGVGIICLIQCKAIAGDNILEIDIFRQQCACHKLRGGSVDLALAHRLDLCGIPCHCLPYHGIHSESSYGIDKLQRLIGCLHKCPCLLFLQKRVRKFTAGICDFRHLNFRGGFHTLRQGRLWSLLVNARDNRRYGGYEKQSRCR